MAFKLRLEEASTNLMALEEAKTMASSQGEASLDAFVANSEADAVKVAPELGIGEGGDSGSSDPDQEPSGTDGGDAEISDSDFDDMPEEAADPEEDPEEESEEEPEPTEEETARTESLRTLSFLPQEGEQLRYESLLDSLGDFGSHVWSGAAYTAALLGSVGIKLTSTLMVGMYKVVLYTFAKTFKVIGEAADGAATYLERFNNRISRQKQRVDVLFKQIEAMRAKGVRPKAGVTVTKEPVGLLMLDNSSNVESNLADFNGFMRSVVVKLNNGMLSDLQKLEDIAKNRYLRREFDAMGMMKVRPSDLGFTQSVDNDSQEDSVSELCSCYGTDEIIGHVQLRAYLPSRNFDTWDQIEEAYLASKIFLAPSDSVRHVQYGEMLSLKETESLLLTVSALIGEIEKHKVFYEEIAARRSGLLTTVKSLFIRLAQETVKVNFKNSTVLPLYLKSSFATKVYLVGAIDLHDHSSRVVANALSYVESVLKNYELGS